MSAAISLSTRLLRRGGMEGQDFLDGGARAVVQPEGDSGLRLLLAAFQFEAQFDEEKLVEDQADVRRGARGLQVVEALARIGPVHFHSAARGEIRPRWARTAAGMASGRSGVRLSKRGANDSAKPARGEASSGLVDGNDAADFERCGGLFLDRIFAVFVGIAQDFESAAA